MPAGDRALGRLALVLVGVVATTLARAEQLDAPPPPPAETGEVAAPPPAPAPTESAAAPTPPPEAVEPAAPAPSASVRATPPTPTRVPPTASAQRPPAACPRCCRFAVEVAPRAGLSINGDQWVFGSQLRTSLPCLGELGLGPTLTLGLGGNHFTIRSGGRLDYMLWFDDARVFGMYPSLGASAFFYMPVGPFATFCHRVDLEACSGYDVGGGIGGGVRYRAFAIDAFAGFGALPRLTIMAAMAFALTGAEGQ